MNVKVSVQSDLYKITDDVINAIANTVGESVTQVSRQLEQEIGSKAPSLIEAYTSAISVDISSLGFSFYLTDERLKQLDKGIPPYDMKPGFRRNATPSKSGGWYTNVPFRHMTPPVGGKNSLSWHVYNQVRKMSTRQRYQDNSPVGVSHTGYVHKASKLQGLKRVVASYGSNYYTFRRVSNNSDPASWIHPGRPGINIFDSISRYSQSTFTDLLNQNLLKIK